MGVQVPLIAPRAPAQAGVFLFFGDLNGQSAKQGRHSVSFAFAPACRRATARVRASPPDRTKSTCQSRCFFVFRGFERAKCDARKTQCEVIKNARFIIERCVLIEKTQTDHQTVVYFLHKVVGEFSDPFAKAAFVDRSDLLQKNDRVLRQSVISGGERDMSWEFCFSELARDRRGDDGGAVFIANVVLNDEDGSDAALFASDDRAQVGVI